MASERATPDAIDALRAAVSGKVFEPTDDGYDAARAGWNLNVDHRPVVIVAPTTTADIVLALRFADDAMLGVAVQNTGHGAVLPCDGLLIVTSQMKALSFSGDVVTVEPGVTWGELNAAAHHRGLVGLSGYVADVGVYGHALGGGIGWFSREFGYAADSIVGATLISADGTTYDAADPNLPPELLWGLRGGSGNFGIVASLELRCYPVTRVYGGSIVFALEDAREVVRRFAAWCGALPDACSPSITIIAMPADPEVPAAIRGRTVVKLGVCFNGPAADGEALMATWDDVQPLSRELGTLETSELDRIEPGPPGPMRTYSQSAEFVELPDAAIDALVASFESESPLRMLEIRAVGGAMLRPRTASAAGDGEARFIIHVQATLDDSTAREQARRAVETVIAETKSYATGGVSLSFMPDGDEAAEFAYRAYDDDTYERLQLLKHDFDPDDVFRYNVNIEPLTDAD